MGTVGINFGAASSGQGFDVASTVTAILASQKAIETPWTTQLASLQAQDTVFTTLGTDLSSLTTAMQALTDFSGVFSEKQGSSSNTDVLSLTSATTSATAGSHTILVNKLAQVSSEYSDTLASATDTLSGSLTIQGDTITIGSSNNTLATLASAINSANIGVNASVVTDSTGSRLSLVSTTSGSAGQLTISGALTDATTSTSIGFHTGQTGQDASLTVDGIALTSGSNTVTTAIPGVTFQLLSTSANPVQVQITNGTTDVSTAVSNIVTAYNAVIKDIKGQEANDSSGNPEPLFGSPTLSLLQNQLSSALISGAASGSISSITQLGIGFNQDGTLTLNGDTLNNALDNNFSDVTGFFQNASSFGQTFVTTLNNLGTQAPDGAIYLAQQQNSAEEAALNLSVSNEEALLATEQTNLTTELNTANQVLQSIPSQLNEVNELYSAVTGYNTGNGG
ncbi:flagellar filament capping protein FliD [Edaphobacter dinghuensis]|uniref:Flagellar hook-associated protein 2 n=1 Tax=Edaphobacter dinghuensis TaxID=1560005 RepID=A0A917HKH9_9BACT|nr:flagellar filament capping protein FliD [Edaphobacter dinghuensis]GGG81892.1 B-type flagellar hook-associated protein 2 [Edaphobacter dinghuensis]